MVKGIIVITLVMTPTMLTIVGVIIATMRRDKCSFREYWKG